MKVGIAQINHVVGDLEGNSKLILDAYWNLVDQGAELVVTPELSLTGYPPRDLIFKSGFVSGTLDWLDYLHSKVADVPLLVGYVDHHAGKVGKPFENAAALLQQGREKQKVVKCLLPTYDVFDEARYFQPAESVKPLDVGGIKLGVTLCEDVWSEEFLPSQLYVKDPAGALAEQGIDLMVNMSASPFHAGKVEQRHKMLAFLARRIGCPVVYCNAVAGNDQLIFDGNSISHCPDGKVLLQCPGFEESLSIVDTEAESGDFNAEHPMQEIYSALVLGVRDYLHKCGFKSAVVGLSGGIDSALTVALACDALGADNVLGVTMPSEFSSEGSVDDSLTLANNLGMRCETIAISEVFKELKGSLSGLFDGLAEDVTEENMQARIRGLMLMSISNKIGHMLLTTGNKSELAVGYCTIYGDMCGGLAVISDLPKTIVYELSRWINRENEIIPWNTITKAPSAELRNDQKDQDTLPEYDLLDQILELYVEQSLSVADIVGRGYAEEIVRWVQRQVDSNEWKRGQAAPGLRVTSKAFGAGRRIPVAQGFKC
ncbi:MAG: NAD+ synthase [Verrucomicrobiaceae bacterium]|nr:NAD+ synthase [Verrucomicrobiaceae bacterium]